MASPQSNVKILFIGFPPRIILPPDPFIGPGGILPYRLVHSLGLTFRSYHDDPAARVKHSSSGPDFERQSAEQVVRVRRVSGPRAFDYHLNAAVQFGHAERTFAADEGKIQNLTIRSRAFEPGHIGRFHEVHVMHGSNLVLIHGFAGAFNVAGHPRLIVALAEHSADGVGVRYPEVLTIGHRFHVKPLEAANSLADRYRPHAGRDRRIE